MMYCVDVGEFGKIVQARQGSSLNKLEGLDQIFIDEPLNDTEVKYVVDGALVDTPLKPSEHHRFNYETRQWIDPRTPATQWPIVRQERDRLLASTDWTQLPDVPLATKEAWAVYRQALRDVTLQPDPFNITWPEVPSK